MNRLLRWHYRSRDPSLIEVSNDEFYGGDLFLPPSPRFDRRQDGFMVRTVAGSYDRGGKKTNRIEADEIIRAAKRHAREAPDRSLGIVTFSINQRQLVEDLLEFARREDAVLEKFATRGGPEPLFVKNLENVQGDERDVIFVSVGYGPRQQGQGLDSMVFGPVSSEGGERRLNVLFTRARFRCEVFVSFASGDIDLSRTRQRGPQVLKRFLKFGETGSMDMPIVHGDFDSPFEEAVAASIQAMGYEVDSQVGTAGFKVDLAVKDQQRPGSYLCAVECDGANYHSSRSARERDRLRQEILEGHGWAFYRIWSTDWFRRPDREKEKLRIFLTNASAKIQAPPPVPEPEEIPELNEISVDSNNPVISLPNYVEANFPVEYSVEPHELRPREMADVAIKIVQLEGPVHEDEIARRVARLFGKERTGARIAEAVGKGLKFAKASGKIDSSDGFWIAPDSNAVSVRSRKNASPTLRRADMLPPAEIREAVKHVEQQNGEVDGEELLLSVTRLLGFDRMGPELREAIRAALAICHNADAH